MSLLVKVIPEYDLLCVMQVAKLTNNSRKNNATKYGAILTDFYYVVLIRKYSEKLISH